MEQITFSKLLLKTAFSCMACDGDIDQREVELIKKIHQEKQLFGDIDIIDEMQNLLAQINENGQGFLSNYFNELSTSSLNENQELNLIEVAIDTIKADDKIEYSEIKFFKVIRSKLKISNKKILEKHPDFEEYLEQDIISESYLFHLQNDFFNSDALSEITFNRDLFN